MLSSLGGWIDVRGVWDVDPSNNAARSRSGGTRRRSAATTTSASSRRALFPSGHPAVVIKVVERKIQSSRRSRRTSPTCGGASSSSSATRTAARRAARPAVRRPRVPVRPRADHDARRLPPLLDAHPDAVRRFGDRQREGLDPARGPRPAVPLPRHRHRQDRQAARVHDAARLRRPECRVPPQMPTSIDALPDAMESWRDRRLRGGARIAPRPPVEAGRHRRRDRRAPARLGAREQQRRGGPAALLPDDGVGARPARRRRAGLGRDGRALDRVLRAVSARRGSRAPARSSRS